MTAWHDSLTKKFQTRRANKYNAKRLAIAGESYDSGLEAEVHETLRLLERTGSIENIRRQVVIELTPRVKFRIDYVVFEKLRNTDIGVEAKGFESERWRVIKQLWPDFGPFPMQVWGKARGRIFMFKEIKGK